MAFEKHVRLLRQGADVWNKWRQENPRIQPDLIGARLESCRLDNFNLIGANLCDADLSFSALYNVNLMGALLRGTGLEYSTLKGANLRGARLQGANLTGAVLSGADFQEAHFGPSRHSEAREFKRKSDPIDGKIKIVAEYHQLNRYLTCLNDVDLSCAKNLAFCHHDGPSSVDISTLAKSRNVPLQFWRGCGLSDKLIDYLPSLTEEAIHFYSCFISLSSKDQEFANRLYSDLQSNGVRCWFAPEDMKMGDHLVDTIEYAIRVRDKVLLILSETSVASAWVEKEVKTALEEEVKQEKLVLVPIRIDDSVLDTTDQWAHEIRRQRHIGDFSLWKNHDAYQEKFARLLHDLKAGC